MTNKPGPSEKHHAAVVIAFPQRPVPDRLERSLSRLLRANQEQAAAVAAWRETLRELQGAMTGLAASVGQYQAALGHAAARVEELGAEARRTETALDG